MDTDTLIQQIERFAKANKIAPATVTSRAVGNSRLYARMKKGGSCTLPIAQKLLSYMGCATSTKQFSSPICATPFQEAGK